jgi:ankyrin repeat protein
MKKKRYFEAVKVETPCTKEWDEMIGNDRVRFCSHCAKDVNNLSAMTRRDALRLVRRSNGQLCMRYILDPRTNRPMFAEQIIQISRRAPRMAASVMTASLSLSAMAYAQSDPSPERPASKLVVSEAAPIAGKTAADETAESNGVIRGTITDQKGAVIPEADVQLSDKAGDVVMKTVSGFDGTYKFEQLPAGDYRVDVSASHFLNYIASLRVTGSEEITENFELSPYRAVSGAGVIVIRKVNHPPLVFAIISDEVETAETLLASGADANVVDEDNGRTPIFEAIERNNLDMVKLLLKFGAKLDVEDEEKMTPLMMISEDSSLELVELLLKKGAKVNAVAENGDTPLILAAREAKTEVLKALIDAGAELNVQNKEGVSALMNAADDENLESVRLLVLAGAKINLRDNDGDNAWDYTAEDEIEAFLVSHGVELDMGEAEGLDADTKKQIRGDFDYEEPAADEDEPADDEPSRK